MKPPLPLTEKEKAVLSYIEQSFAERGLSPSYLEIKNYFGFASFNSVQNYLKQLTQKGYISVYPNQKRAIRLLHSSDFIQQEALRVTEEEPVSSSLLIPLLGKVAAGRPLEALTHDESIDVPSSMVRQPQKTFALKVVGDSMIDDGIFDGDLILVEKQANARSGEVVVASIENESTVKKYFLKLHPEKREMMVELRPANSHMDSLWYPPDKVSIQGVLVGLLRKFL